MKYVFSVLTMILFVSASFAQDATEVKKDYFKPSDIIKFDKYMVHLGDVKHGEKKSIVYIFENVGTEDLEIELISACDCTETQYPTLPIKPGDLGQIDVIFHSDRKEKNDEIDIDIILKNINPDNGYQVIERVQYDYTLTDIKKKEVKH